MDSALFLFGNFQLNLSTILKGNKTMQSQSQHTLPVQHLATRAVLVTLNISVWGAKTKDADATRVVNQHFNTDANVGDFILELLPKEALAQIKSAEANARKIYNQNSQPWVAGGNILQIGKLPEFRTKMRESQSEFDIAVREFLENYENKWIPEAQKKNAKLFKAHKMPTLEQIRRKFGFRTGVYPVPNVIDWRADIDESTMEGLKNNLIANMEDALTGVKKAIAEKIIGELGHFVRKLDEYGGKGTNFQQRTIDKMKALSESVKNANLLDDNDLEELQKQIATLSDHDADDLKEDDNYRNETVKNANDILNKVQDILG